MMYLYMLEACPECCELKSLLYSQLEQGEPIKKLCLGQIDGIETTYFLDSDEARNKLDEMGYEDYYTPLLIDEKGDVFHEPEEIAIRVLPYILKSI